MPSTDAEEELRHQFLLTGIATGPATPDQIDALEETLGFALPVAYRAYLRVCGTHPPTSLVGSDCVIDHVEFNNHAALELLSESNASHLAPTKFVALLLHQGYTFLHFPIDGSDDPPCFCYLEGDAHFKPIADQFSHWVMSLS